MAKLILQDADKAVLFSFSQECKTTQEAAKELTARGWSQEAAQQHINASIIAGAYLVADAARAEAAHAETEKKA